ncbi:MAG: chromate resistance protein [Rhodospirillales bacterium]|nr:chromate resistance protein [Rhodospirillales bacterium]
MMLLHNIPPKPAYFRVKIWRRLQGLGAVAVKNAAYVLPRNEQALEDLSWVCRAIEEGGGEAVLCEARFIDGLDEAGLRALFDAARDGDYAAIAEEARTLAEASAEDEAEAGLRRLRRRFDQVAAIDFFQAEGRAAADAALAGLEGRMKRRQAGPAAAPGKAGDKPAGRVWVTRASVYVDRIASAWLIRRFVDPKARFKFVAERSYLPNPDELRFDMYDAEFTHEGDLCTFEVLRQRFAPADPALAQLAEIVHDIDLKDGKFQRAEAGGLAQMMTGICAATNDDDERLKRGAELCETLYRSFGGGALPRGTKR